MAIKPEIKGGGVLGTKVEGARRQLDTFELPTTHQSVSYSSDEVTSFCPVTGQPDFYDVDIDLYASKKGIESKSLKLYLQSFNSKEEGQFCEDFADTICRDVYKATMADEVVVTLRQKPRGGVSINATSKLERAQEDPETLGPVPPA